MNVKCHCTNKYNNVCTEQLIKFAGSQEPILLSKCGGCCAGLLIPDALGEKRSEFKITSSKIIQSTFCDDLHFRVLTHCSSSVTVWLCTGFICLLLHNANQQSCNLQKSQSAT
ncbi:hypothetical protein XENOCAPTIV_018914 [Xenoophorus captivus]|uniref:Uncharacterized protein n=1 Tax=Xenoophorus captivus TaxID=1517983 RepID=A0ABV0SH98_9TELE